MIVKGGEVDVNTEQMWTEAVAQLVESLPGMHWFLVLITRALLAVYNTYW